MAPSDGLQRAYLEGRRRELHAEQAIWQLRTLTARNEAADLVRRRAAPAEVERFRQLALDAQARCAQIARALAALDAELRPPEAAALRRALLQRRRAELAAQLEAHRAAARAHRRQAEVYMAEADAPGVSGYLAHHVRWAAERIESICAMFAAAIAALDAELAEG